MTCSRPNCAKPAVSGRKMCDGHARYFRVQSRKSRRERAAAGLCPWAGCARPPVPGKRDCLVHAAYYSAAQLKLKARRKAPTPSEADA